MNGADDKGVSGAGGFSGELWLQGSRAVAPDVLPRLREQLVAEGLEPAAWTYPVFTCDELQTAALMPIFTSQRDLIEAWELAGRSRDALPDKLTVLDLRLLVHHMASTDKFAWSTVQFLCSPQAVELVAEAKEQREALSQDGGGE